MQLFDIQSLGVNEIKKVMKLFILMNWFGKCFYTTMAPPNTGLNYMLETFFILLNLLYFLKPI